MPKNSLSHTFVSDPDEVADFFQALIDGFKNRKVTISSDGQEQSLIPAELVDLTVETVQRKGRVRLNIFLSWPGAQPHHRPNLLSNLTPPIFPPVPTTVTEAVTTATPATSPVTEDKKET
ncbi:MAG: amphi-Trp domain-containing protein [Deltaproteobacteria bacterium]|jgi:amphi-Trp domain-containing protein|nr:amphi-Trp domain-containing protein [Deltaproteobacteria bacterium]